MKVLTTKNVLQKIHSVSESRGGPLSVTHEQTNKRTEILGSNIGWFVQKFSFGKVKPLRIKVHCKATMRNALRIFSTCFKKKLKKNKHLLTKKKKNLFLVRDLNISDNF